MFEQILALVKEHIGNDSQITASLPAEHAEAIHQEIATHLHDNLQSPGGAPTSAAGSIPGTSTGGGILSTIENSLASGGVAANAITGSLIGALSNKFGLSPAVSGAIAGAVPGLLAKLVHKADSPTA